MKTAICSIIKNEHDYLAEWIDYHLNAGFDEIHLHEDVGSKSHKELIQGYTQVYLHACDETPELLEILLNKEPGVKQSRLYDSFIRSNQSKFDFIALIDIDEFINFADGYNLSDLCTEFLQVPGVLLSWKMFGASGLVNKPEQGGVVENYIQEGVLPEREIGYAFKSFVNTALYEGLHSLHEVIGGVNTNMEADKMNLCYDKAWINHYFTKSWEEWCNRIFSRGSTVNGHRNPDDFFLVNPDMNDLRTQLINSILHLYPVGGMWIDYQNRIMVGGNTHIIDKLNGNEAASTAALTKKAPTEQQLQVIELRTQILSKRQEIKSCIERIAKLDYHGSKYLDGLVGGVEYVIPTEVIQERQSLRDTINALELEIEQLGLAIKALMEPIEDTNENEITN